MNCPDCKTNDVTRAAVEWEKGTRVSVRGGGKPNSRRVSNLNQNLSALKLSPPDRPRAKVWLTIFFIIVGLIIASNVSKSSPSLTGALGIVAFVIPIAWCIWDLSRRKAGHVAAMAHWNTLWFCNRCGTVAAEREFRPASVVIDSQISGPEPSPLISQQ